MTIRKETAEDIPSIRAIVHAAFGSLTEADLVDALRRSGALTLSVVAVLGGRIVGHVALSPVTIGGSARALALAPVAVAPDCQRQGIGSALIRWSLEECERMGYEVILVVGDPKYYSRFGFSAASQFGLECPFPVPPEVFMLRGVAPGAAGGCHGMVRYRPEFESVSTK